MDAPGALSGFLDDAEHRRKRRRLDCQLDVPSKDSLPARSSEDEEDAARLAKLPDAKKRKAQAYSLAVYKPELETIQRDYSQAHVNSLRRPANFVLGAAPEHRFDEYPKLRRLLDLHSAVVAECAHPATRLTTDLRAFDLPSLLPVRYDAILIGPPRTNGIAWTWTDLEALPIPTIAANPSFIWLWVGQGCEDGLERGRALLSKWGYRRCEDIVWLKTNKRGAATDVTPPETLFANTKEHCLMGIRGTVRRSNDAHFIHCNVDTDVIFADEDPMAKPDELYSIIENFCLGTRRLHLFAPRSFARPGWLGVGEDFHEAADGILTYDKTTYETYFDTTATGPALGNLVPNTPGAREGIIHVEFMSNRRTEIDMLRPRTPPPKGQQHGGAFGRSNPFAGFGMAAAQRPNTVGALPPRPTFPSGPALLPPRPLVDAQPPARGSYLPPAVPIAPQFSQPPRQPAIFQYQQQQHALGPHQNYMPPSRPPLQSARPQPPTGPLDLNALAAQMGGWAHLVQNLPGAGRGQAQR